MFLILSDVWTHIVSQLNYKDLYSLKCVNLASAELFQVSAIKSIARAKYEYNRQLFVEMVTDATVRGKVYFTVKDVHFKLYGNDFIQEYFADLHFNCISPWDQDCYDVSKESRYIRIAHFSPANALDNIQIDSMIAQHLKNPEKVACNDQHIYPVRKYPGSPLRIENEFTFEYEPFDTLWPLDTNEIKTCESYEVSFDDLGQLLSKVYHKVDHCWIMIMINKKKYAASFEKFTDLFPYIVTNETINYKYEKYNEYHNFKVIKMKFSCSH